MSISIKRNLILTVLATVFFLLAQAGFDDIEKTGVANLNIISIFAVMFFGLAFIGVSTALVVRLWISEKE